MLNDDERFFVRPDPYLNLRYGGESVSDEKKGIERTLLIRCLTPAKNKPRKVSKNLSGRWRSANG